MFVCLFVCLLVTNQQEFESVLLLLLFYDVYDYDEYMYNNNNSYKEIINYICAIDMSHHHHHHLDRDISMMAWPHGAPINWPILANWR